MSPARAAGPSTDVGCGGPDTGHEDTSEDAGEDASMRQPRTPFDGLRNDAPAAAVRGRLADVRETAASSGEDGR